MVATARLERVFQHVPFPFRFDVSSTGPAAIELPIQRDRGTIRNKPDKNSKVLSSVAGAVATAAALVVSSIICMYVAAIVKKNAHK